ncbi:MHJ_0274 family protein [Mycoplasmopsis glycophila]|uniref:Uncharacterized protein n=1 Tax=Mycoplasmopsis glycophila TaxID=171285 RepID=A0A449AVS6_9BACT|nr:hypothetical protein [Mycoplasmopsis glycophila]VEU70690.1 Uncharacterised protein [Mycoplasmopsis glycophila]
MIFKNTLLLDDNTTSSASGLMSPIILYATLGVLVLIIVIFFLYSWIKEKRTKSQIRKATYELQKETAIYLFELSHKMLALLDENTKAQDEFIPSVGKYKMPQLNQAAKEIIEEEIKSPRFQACFKETEKHNSYVQTIFEIKDTNSNLWDKHLPHLRDYFAKTIEDANNEIKFLDEKSPLETKNPDRIKEDLIIEYKERLEQNAKN